MCYDCFEVVPSAGGDAATTMVVEGTISCTRAWALSCTLGRCGPRPLGSVPLDRECLWIIKHINKIQTRNKRHLVLQYSMGTDDSLMLLLRCWLSLRREGSSPLSLGDGSGVAKIKRGSMSN